MFFTGSKILSAWDSKNYSDKKNGSGKNNTGKTPLIQVKIIYYSNRCVTIDNVLKLLASSDIKQYKFPCCQ